MIPDDVIIRLTKLPAAVDGFTSPSVDGCYNVYINQSLTVERRRRTLRHELDHIERDDFYLGRSLGEVEWE